MRLPPDHLASRAAATPSGSRPLATLSRLSSEGVASAATTVLLLFLFSPLTAAARELQISSSPGAATWRDAVVVIVSGEGPYCAPELTEPVIGFAGGGAWRIDIDLLDDCTLHLPVPGPFTVATTLEPLSPRLATVHVRDVMFGGGVSTAPLTIHRGADLEITVLEPASSAEPLRMELAGVGACPLAEVTSAGAGVVRVEYNGNCAILPPGDIRFTLPLEAGPLPPGLYEIQVFDRTDFDPPPVVTTHVLVWDAARCVPTATSHCLELGRFRVEARFRDFQNRTGDGKATTTALDDTGLFWFFSPDNIELTVKVLDGCGVNGYLWVFVSSGSTVEYDVEVTDTVTGRSMVYGNELGELPELFADTSAFACG